MRIHRIGPPQLAVSEIGLGCMGMSEFYGPTNDADSTAALDAAIAQGVLFFDTADMYGRGHNERLIGSHLKNRSRSGDEVIATKFGIARDLVDPYRRAIDNSWGYMKGACEASLRRLRRDAIDLYYVHRIDDRRPIEDTVGDLARLVDQGKIRGIGLCEASADTIRRAHAVYPLTAVQNEYSLFTRDAEPEVLPACHELGIAFVAYSPLGRGLLTGQVPTFGAGDMRPNLPRFQGEHLSRNLALVVSVCAIADRHGATPGQVALAWLLSRPELVIPIPGTRRASRVIENAATANLVLSAHDLAYLDIGLPAGAALDARYTAEGMKGVQM